MGVGGIIPRAEVGKSTGCRRLSRLYRCLIERQVRGGVTRVAPLLSAAYRPSSRHAFYQFFSFSFLPFFPSPSEVLLGSASGTPGDRRRPTRHWLKAWKTGHPRRAIGQGSPLSSSCQSGAWLNLWMIKRWMVSARVVKSPRFEPRSWSFPRYILFTWHVTWLFHVSMKLRAGNSTRFGEFLNPKWFHVQIETFNILIFHVSLRVEIEG